MKKNSQILKNAIGIGVIITIAIAIWSSTSVMPKVRIQFSENRPELFTKTSLTKYLRETISPTIVLRVEEAVSTNLTKNNLANSNIYNTIEKEFSKAGYVVRDRALFNKVIEDKVDNYNKIKDLTSTDLILELVSFEKIKYATNKYIDARGNQKVSKVDYEFAGRKAEFKLIKVKDNDIVGSYTFHFAPCSEGCTFEMSSFGKLYPVSVQSGIKKELIPYEMAFSQDEIENFFKKCTIRLITELRTQ